MSVSDNSSKRSKGHGIRKPRSPTDLHATLSTNMDDTAIHSSGSGSGSGTSFEICEAINHCFANAAVFEQVSSDVEFTCAALDRRVLSLEDTSDQLTLACKRYVKRFKKRMEILEKKGGVLRRQARHMHWAVRMRAFLEKPFTNRYSTVLYVFISSLIILSCILVIVQTVPRYNPELFPELGNTWLTIEIGLSMVFLIEILARFIAFTCDPTTKAWYLNARDFFFSVSNDVDIAATVFPTFSQFYGQTHPLISVSRLLRLFRIFFMLRHFDAFEDLEETLKKSLPSLSGPLIGLLVAITGFASVIFTLEVGSYNRDGNMQFMVRNEDCELTAGFVLDKVLCPRSESKFVSVVHTMWFVLITFLTVGYGDLVPLTMMGRFFGAVAAVSGSLFMAMPIAIVGTSFTVVVARLRSERRAVKTQIEREQLKSEASIAKLQGAIAATPALPSLTFCRFVRLALKEDMLFFAAATRKSIFFIDLFLLRVVDSLLDPTMTNRLNKIWTRKRPGKPYSCRLVLTARPFHTGFVAHQPQHSLVRAVRMPVGTSEFAHVKLWSATAQSALYRIFLENHLLASSSPLTSSFSMVGAKQQQQLQQLQQHQQQQQEVKEKMKRRRHTNEHLQAQLATAEKLISSHHADLTLVHFGGDADKVYAEPVAQFATLLDDEHLQTRKEIKSGDVMRFDPTCSSAAGDKLTVEFEYGVKIEPFANVAVRVSLQHSQSNGSFRTGSET